MSVSVDLEFTLPGEGGRRHHGTATIEPWTPLPHIRPKESTSQADYRDALDRLVPELARRSGKTVIARTICGQAQDIDVHALAGRYFKAMADTPSMCFLFDLPGSGLWMGATPELLLQSHAPGVFETQALAGTRPASSSEEPWDAKNIEEHRFVTAEMCACLEALGLEVEMAQPDTCRYGKIEHLRTRIVARGDADFDTVAHALHPTAAVCGYPRRDAISEIERFEKAPRNCYAGLICVDADGSRYAYVVLRCVHFDSEGWTVYSGSGITAASDAADEWRETEAKAAPLVDLLSADK